MVKVFEYYGRAQGVGGRLIGLPFWGRALITLAALPGLILMGLSVLAFGVSLLALLLLTAPVYRLVRALTPDAAVSMTADAAAVKHEVQHEVIDGEVVSSGPATRRPIEVKIVE
jgi:hypothetical protein